jgi:16S rRNA (cytosine1402-N4)-methyltransferase
VIRDYGEERFAASIAKALVARRESGQPLRTTGELAELVARSVRTREPGQDPRPGRFKPFGFWSTPNWKSSSKV